jgi:hypothetical protein
MLAPIFAHGNEAAVTVRYVTQEKTLACIPQCPLDPIRRSQNRPRISNRDQCSLCVDTPENGVPRRQWITPIPLIERVCCGGCSHSEYPEESDEEESIQKLGSPRNG